MSGRPRNVRVGFLGPGLMGAPMATRIAASGFPTAVWARRPQVAAGLASANLTPVSSPRDAARGAGIVVAMLPDLPDLDALTAGPEGLWSGVGADVVLVICSTVSPAAVQAFARRAAFATGGRVRVVDAPVSGGVAKASDGTLSILVGGSDADVAIARPVLEACGTPLHLGPLGAGEIAKACNQLVVAAEVAALSEASLLARDAGIDLTQLFDALGRGLAASRVLDDKRDKLTRADYSASGPARFMSKDLRFAAEAGAASGTPTPLTAFLRTLYDGLNAAGLGHDDIVVMQRYIDQHHER